MLRFSIALLLVFIGCIPLHAQLLNTQTKFSKADSLRGELTPFRTCYDINYYHLDVAIDLEKRSVKGSNEFRFTATENFNKLQFDLFASLNIERVTFNGSELPFYRSFNAVFITFPSEIKKGTKHSFTVYYSGNPSIAANPPWDGGFIFTKDKSGNPWASVACQGYGASSWWPNKDHQSDEVDSMLISINVPGGFKEVSNGRLRSIVDKKDGTVEYNWFVSNPINNYNVTFYIGKYAHWTDSYKGENGDLSIDYWSLAEDSVQARGQWDKDVKRMLKSFEHWFGPYPFYKDGYKLVQAPHLGMEHQSAIAYGNKFRMGYLGRDYSGSASNWGLKFDYIVVHESGHEWFGNNITSKDIADMWIHEAFTSYSEVLFLESYYGKAAGTEYAISSRRNIGNSSPVIGKYGVNSEGSGDMYYKGVSIIHTIRAMIGNDEKFRALLRGLNKTFYHKTITTKQLEDYISSFTGLKLDKFFDQYLRKSSLPILEYSKNESGVLRYRWVTDIEGFSMPLKAVFQAGIYSTIYPGADWKSLKVDLKVLSEGLKIDPDFYITVKEVSAK
ncbi:MAG: M1 family metallopeptidase [Bacteroidota bacterium]